MSNEFYDYFLESILAEIREEFKKNKNVEETEDAYIIGRLSQIAEKIVRDTK